MTRAARESRNPAGVTEDEDRPAPAETADPFVDAAAMRKERQRQLQYVREFFNNPLLLDLRSAPITTGSDPAEIEQRKKDLSYRIEVLDALRTLMADELAEIERIGRSGE